MGSLKQSIEFLVALTVDRGAVICDYRYPYSWEVSPKSAWSFFYPTLLPIHASVVIGILRNRGIR